MNSIILEATPLLPPSSLRVDNRTIALNLHVLSSHSRWKSLSLFLKRHLVLINKHNLCLCEGWQGDRRMHANESLSMMIGHFSPRNCTWHLIARVSCCLIRCILEHLIRLWQEKEEKFKSKQTFICFVVSKHSSSWCISSVGMVNRALYST